MKYSEGALCLDGSSVRTVATVYASKGSHCVHSHSCLTSNGRTINQLNDDLNDCSPPNNQRGDRQRPKADEKDESFAHCSKGIGGWFSVGLIQKIREIEHDQGSSRIG